MKKIILIVISITVISLNAQVKIGTNTTTLAANALFQVEGSSNVNQLTVLKNGNLGIGTIAPISRLETIPITSVTAGNLSAWNKTAATFGRGDATGAAVGIGFDSVNNTGWISSLTPSVTWSKLKLSALSYKFIVAGSTPALTILDNGNVGIGNINPTAQFETTGSVKFSGTGTPGSDKVLTSDSTGNATWQTTPIYSKILTNDPIGINTSITLTNNNLKDLYFVDARSNILLPALSPMGTQIKFYIFGSEAVVLFPNKRTSTDTARFNTTLLDSIGNVNAGWAWYQNNILFDGSDSRLRMVTFISDGNVWWPTMSK